MTDFQTTGAIYQFDVLECREDNGIRVWIGDAWGEDDFVPVFRVEGASLAEVLKQALARLEITDAEQTTTKERWYAVAEKWAYEEDSNAWTLSRDPNVVGWNTDCACDGYGLSRLDAEFLAAAANEKLENHGPGGMSLRDWFAGMSMAFVFASRGETTDYARATGFSYPLWRHHGCIQGLLASLAFAMAPEGADMQQFHEFMRVNEFGLALKELAGVVNHGG